MEYLKKSEHIQECIDRLENSGLCTLYIGPVTFGAKECIETLEQFKAEVDLLASQEAEQHALDVMTDVPAEYPKQGYDPEVIENLAGEPDRTDLLGDPDEVDEYKMHFNLD